MNANYLMTLNTEDVITKEDIITALTEAEVDFNKSMKKADLMEVLVNAIETAEAQNGADNVNANLGSEAPEIANTVSLDDCLATIRLNNGIEALAIHDKAEAFYLIKLHKLYEAEVDAEGNPYTSIAKWIEGRGGSVEGVKKSTIYNYINLCKYVYPQREEFRFYGMHLLGSLIAPLKSEETRGAVLEAVDDGIINQSMSLDALKEVLDRICGKEAEAEVEEAEVDNAEAEDSYENSNTCEISEEALDNAVDIIEEYLDNNAHDNDVTNAWFMILKALNR